MSRLLAVVRRAAMPRIVWQNATTDPDPVVTTEGPSYLLMSRDTFYEIRKVDIQFSVVSPPHDVIRGDVRPMACGVPVAFDDWLPHGIVISVYGANSHG